MSVAPGELIAPSKFISARPLQDVICLCRVQWVLRGVDCYVLPADQRCFIANVCLGRLFGVTKHFAEAAGGELRIFRRGRIVG
jgi:hypothetical protein